MAIIYDTLKYEIAPVAWFITETSFFATPHCACQSLLISFATLVAPSIDFSSSSTTTYLNGASRDLFSFYHSMASSSFSQGCIRNRSESVDTSGDLALRSMASVLPQLAALWRPVKSEQFTQPSKGSSHWAQPRLFTSLNSGQLGSLEDGFSDLPKQLFMCSILGIWAQLI